MVESTESENTTTISRQETSSRRRFVKIVLAVSVPLILLGAIGHSIWTNWDHVRTYVWELNPLWLLASAVLMWLDFVIIILLWRNLLVEVSDQELTFRTAYRISVISNLGKYLPGKIWAMMGMVYFLKREGYSSTVALASTVLHQAFLIVAGFSFLIFVLGPTLLERFPLLPIVLGIGGSLAVLYPPMFSRILNWGLKLMKRDPVQIPRSFGRALVRLVFYILAWITYGASMWCMVLGLGIQPDVFWEVVAAFGAAYLIGFLALFAPGGLGVREGVIVVLLTPYLPAGLPAAIAVAARLWTTIIELLGLTPVLGDLRKFRGFKERMDPDETTSQKIKASG